MIERLQGLQTHQVVIVDFFFEILNYMLEQLVILEVASNMSIP